jgi:hypothetical protein
MAGLPNPLPPPAIPATRAPRPPMPTATWTRSASSGSSSWGPRTTSSSGAPMDNQGCRINIHIRPSMDQRKSTRNPKTKSTRACPRPQWRHTHIVPCPPCRAVPCRAQGLCRLGGLGARDAGGQPTGASNVGSGSGLSGRRGAYCDWPRVGRWMRRCGARCCRTAGCSSA